jgi:hypothetical protein
MSGLHEAPRRARLLQPFLQSGTSAAFVHAQVPTLLLGGVRSCTGKGWL